MPLVSAPGVLEDDAVVVERDVGELRTAVHVPCGIDAIDVGAQVLVHLHGTARRDLYPCGTQVKRRSSRLASYRTEHGIGLKDAPVGQPDPDTVSLLFEECGRVVEVEVDVASLKHALGVRRDVRLEVA